LLSRAGQFAVRFATVALIVAFAIAGRRLLRRHRLLRARSWPERWNDRLDQLGSKSGHVREPGQTARAFATDVGLHGDDWDAALATLDRAAYAAGNPPEQDLRAAEELLAFTLKHR
jgi:Domain of unknown function (DUF4129)